MAVLATDDFNRANSSSLGANWSVQVGSSSAGIGVDSNQVYIDAGATVFVYYNAVLPPDDQYCQAKFIETGTNTDRWAVAVRAQSGAASGYYGGRNQSSFGTYELRIWKRDAAGPTLTSLAVEASSSLAVNDVIKLEVSGTTFNLYVNGVFRLTATDSQFASGYAGLSIRQASGTNTLPVLDDWEVGDSIASRTPLVGSLVVTGIAPVVASSAAAASKILRPNNIRPRAFAPGIAR